MSDDRPEDKAAGSEASAAADAGTAADTASAPAPAASDSVPAGSQTKPEPPAPPAAAPARRGGFIAWLALLLVLALAAGSAYVVLEARRLEARLDDRVASLETAPDRDNAEVEQAMARLEASVEQRLGSGLDAAASELAQQTGQLQQQATQLQQLAAALEQQGRELEQQRAELQRYSATDRESWLLAEAEYLVRLANQRLIMTGDTESAQALLGSADAILRQLDDAALHPVRAALASDLAAIRAVPKLDVEGLYLRLAALIEQAAALAIFQMPELEAQVPPEPAQDWQDRLRQGYDAALRKLSDYIIIRRRDVPMAVLMDPQWEGLVRQNLRMLLEQAQVALLSGNQVLYRESLARAEHWVGEFFASDEAAARALASELRQLMDQTVQVALPDTTRSLRALEEAASQRATATGGV